MVKFSLFCNTQFGQNLFVAVDGVTYPMRYNVNALWTAEVDLSGKRVAKYEYFIKNSDNSIVYDAQRYRCVPKFGHDLVIEDYFVYASNATVFDTKPFIDTWFRRNDMSKFPVIAEDETLIVLHAPGVKPEECVAVVGEGDILGNWMFENRIDLTPTENAMWWIKLPNDTRLTHSEYKFIVYRKNVAGDFVWENGNNRRMPVMSGNKMISATVNIDYDWHARGVAIPVFSIRTAESWGVGDFMDLRKMCDWAVRHNQKIIQILPINDTTSTNTVLDSYPYRANSIYALHPMYVNVEAVGELNDRKAMRLLRKRAAELNGLDAVDYVAVNNLKTEFMRAKYAEVYDLLEKNADYNRFIKQNRHWIIDYAVFSFLRGEFCTDDWKSWGEYAKYSSRKAKKLFEEHKKEVSFFCFVQYHLDKQLREAIAYLHECGVAMKGDLPIGISANSVDAWVAPELFNLDKQAGAPPDDFSIKGQNWGFPTYNWHAMEQSGFDWWKRRFTYMASYFDAFRIDHILGFFRIWEIPMEAKWGLLGYFSPALPFSVGEIAQYGVGFDELRFTKPYVRHSRLKLLFGDDTDYVIDTYLDYNGDSTYRFKAEYPNQKSLPAADVRPDLLDKLLSLYCEVIFIEDPYKPGYYHPRINVMASDSFAALDSRAQYQIRQLHDEFFYRRNLMLWKNEAMRKLPELVHTNNMLVCGEDLGMVPDCVPHVMNELKILSLEIERMPKQSNCMFVDQSAVPYLSVSATGTHDTSTLRGWWGENSRMAQLYYNSVLHNEGIAPEGITADIVRNIVLNQLNNNSILTILPWQDYMSCDADYLEKYTADDRINVPDNPNHIWCWRMPVEI